VFVSDLNGFKLVNDRFGHFQGNKLLQAFAEALKESCREYDYAARMGGDEFVVVAAGLDEKAATEIRRRVETIIAQVGKSVCGEDIVSASIGQAFYPADGSNAEHLLAEADRRMYGAKRSYYEGMRDEPGKARSARATS
jgi:diguanylate cyclase (GGDEF)-like protein